MGIGDLFGKGKKKAEFREAAKEALQGKLTPGKAAELEKLRLEHDVDAGDDKTMLRRDVYNKAVGAVRARGKLSDAETAELAKIQKFLALRDDQVERTKWDLVRLRTLTEIRKGRLPVVAASNVAVRSIGLPAGETAHYGVQVEVLDRPTTSGMDGVAVKWGTPYVINSAQGHSLPSEGFKELGEGYLLITNKRLVFKGAGKTAAVEYSPQANFFLYSDAIRLERTVGNTFLRFKSKSDDTAEIVGELLAALMR
jgi:hypothetical protein